MELCILRVGLGLGLCRFGLWGVGFAVGGSPLPKPQSLQDSNPRNSEPLLRVYRIHGMIDQNLSLQTETRDLRTQQPDPFPPGVFNSNSSTSNSSVLIVLITLTTTIMSHSRLKPAI